MFGQTLTTEEREFLTTLAQPTVPLSTLRDGVRKLLHLYDAVSGLPPISRPEDPAVRDSTVAAAVQCAAVPIDLQQLGQACYDAGYESAAVTAQLKEATPDLTTIICEVFADALAAYPAELAQFMRYVVPCTEGSKQEPAAGFTVLALLTAICLRWYTACGVAGSIPALCVDADTQELEGLQPYMNLLTTIVMADPDVCRGVGKSGMS